MIFSLIELRRYCSELLQRNVQTPACHVVQKTFVARLLYVRRNNGKAHLITVYALLNRIHRKLVKNQKSFKECRPSIPYKIGYKPEIYRTAPQYPHVLNRGYFHIEEFPLYFVRSLSCVLRQKFSRL